MPHPALPVAKAWDEVHTFLRSREVTAICGVPLLRLPPAAPDEAREPRTLSPNPGWGLRPSEWAALLACLPPQC